MKLFFLLVVIYYRLPLAYRPFNRYVYSPQEGGIHGQVWAALAGKAGCVRGTLSPRHVSW